MGKVVRIPAGNTTNVHYNFVVAKPLVHIISEHTPKMTIQTIDLKGGCARFEVEYISCNLPS